MKPLKKFFLITLYILNAIIVGVLVVSAFSGYISPQRFVFFSYLGLLFPFILIGNIAVFIVWLLFKQWKPVLINIVAFCICGGAIYTYCPLHAKTKEIPADAIKILTYNVMRFNNMKKDAPKGDPPNKILQYIKESDADIVCLQEYGVTDNSSNYLGVDYIINTLNNYPYHYIPRMKYPFRNQIFDLAFFSKFPIVAFRKVPYESAYNESFVIELDIKGKRVTLINNHLESNKLSEEERSNYYQLTKDPDSQTLDVLTQTMTKRLTPAYKTRAGQADIISQSIEENKNPYIIVCGDFNDTPISYARYKIKGNLRDAFVDSGFGLGITYNKLRFLFRIDYILHSNNIKSYNCTVEKLNSSDHYPLWCYLQLK